MRYEATLSHSLHHGEILSAILGIAAEIARKRSHRKALFPGGGDFSGIVVRVGVAFFRKRDTDSLRGHGVVTDTVELMGLGDQAR
jgi:hypothetical protein